MAAKRKKSTKRTTKRTNNKKNNRTYYAITAFVLIILTVITAFQLGVVGEYIDSFFAYVFGLSRYFTYLVIVLLSVYLATEQKIPFTRRMGGYFLLQFGLLFLFHSILYMTARERIESFFSFDEILNVIQTPSESAFFGGGILGQILFSFSSTGVSLFGTLLLAIICIYFSYLMIAGKNIEEALSTDFSYMIKFTKSLGRGLVQGLSETGKKAKNLYNKLFDGNETRDKADKPAKKKKKRVKEKAPKEKSAAVNDSPKDIEDLTPDETIIESMHSYEETPPEKNEVEEHITDPKIDTTENKPQKIEYETDELEETPVNNDDQGDTIDTFDDEEIAQLKQYKLPSIQILKDAEVSEKMSNKEVLKQGKVLEETLNNFGVKARVSKIRIGPAVTQFEIQPDIGVKVSKIINLQNDIALSLAAKDIRIEAPIPGKSAVGIEVPNSVISMVTLREVLKRKQTDNPLEVVLGKDISGAPITAELNKMPHLLVAGSTGSGKSVCINGIITSLLMNAKPHEVKLMMIDPKMVELNVYNGIPHLLSPVVTNPQKASDALNRIVSEMERRYDLFSHSGTRNIEAYNQYLEKEADEPEKVQKLPYIVVIVDELADLMMVASKDVEAAITRIAQMARAAGIHLIIATQRPSVDVITGIIKANIPSRIAFSVSSQTDSRTIIDGQGAEKLLGKGDMLFLPSGRSKPIRVQGAFLSDSEVYDVVHFITSQMKANYEKSIMNKAPEKEQVESEDELYPDAKWFVIDEQRASASLLQRQFRIGYNRAARLVDDLEANGVIGPASGSKPRAVLIQNEE
jgi:S-DNA-T family DNA segregation ATPase FtsK/SpoIIIE